MNRGPVIEVKVEFDQPGMKFETEPATGETTYCYVDTQVKNQIGIRHMSARYMLTGIDSSGEKCHIYVENNGWLTDDRPSRTFRTVPTFMTDSKTLAPYLHRNQFEGQGSVEEDGLWIRFYEIEH